MKSIIVTFALIAGLYTAFRPAFISPDRALAVTERAAIPMQIVMMRGEQ